MLSKTTSSARGILSMLLLATLVSGEGHSANNLTTTSRMTFTGYLADMLCGRLEIAPDGANMLLSPKDHSVMCELLPACLRSGYGISQDLGSDGQGLYRIGAVLDEVSNDFVVDLLNQMDSGRNDLRVKVTGTFLDYAAADMTPEIVSRDGEGRTWPAMSQIPTISLDSLEFCNYEGPDARFSNQNEACSSESILSLLTSEEGRSTLANANLCMREEVSIVSESDVFGDAAMMSEDRTGYIVNPDGCADHATFQDVKRADPVTCSQAVSDTCQQGCEATDTCASECTDVCGNPLIFASGGTASSCCLDACGNPTVNACGLVEVDACGNPIMADGSVCPAANVAENQVNECVDGCGSVLSDACGNPITNCCLDACSSPLLDPCGFPWLDACGNPALNANGDACPTLGVNMCLPTEPTDCEVGVSCASECTDVCGNPLIFASGGTASSCCLDACGNPTVNACGLVEVDACGNPIMADGSVCPAANIAENEINECIDACGSVLSDACGNPISNCCLDACSSPILDPCGFPWLDACGNPALNANGDACPMLGANTCFSKAEETKCAAECTDACGNPLLLPSGTTASLCCLDACGNPTVNACGLVEVDACGNPIMADGSVCPAANIAENEINECIDACGSVLSDACGNPISNCCLDACSSPILDPCGFPWLDACGNPALNANGDICPTIGENLCLEGGHAGSACGATWRARHLEGLQRAARTKGIRRNMMENHKKIQSAKALKSGSRRLAGHSAAACGDAASCGSPSEGGCSADCVDVCGNPLLLPSGATASSCCLDACSSPILDPCGLVQADACGNPVAADGTLCPADNVGQNGINECIDGCGSVLSDACGNPISNCCLDGCGSPILDPCGFPWLDACGNPALNANGDACPTLGENMCLDQGTDNGDTCSPASLFPPVMDSLQCEGLVSPCTLAVAGDATSTDGIPATVSIGRRRRASVLARRRMQAEASVPLYTPLKKDLRITIPTTSSGMRSRKELDPAHEGVIGVALNGVPIVYEHPGEGANTLLFDSCGGHGDLSNRYHYHLPPVCLLRSLGGTVPLVSDWWLAPSAETQWPSQAKTAEKSPLIGWAIDGAPIFGPYNPDNGELVVPAGAAGGEECSANVLDECNGMVLENGVYAYFMTATAPFVPPCLMGDVPTNAFVDGGLVDSVASVCPFEGTDPLAGTEICDEKTIIFQDSTCPGNQDRLAIRNCFELATNSFVGEPTCDQLEHAITQSSQCFIEAGCCQDLEQTVAAWMVQYPALESSCSGLMIPSCTEFMDDNVVEVVASFETSLASMVPDTRALLRNTVAETLGVAPAQVAIDRVFGTEESSSVIFQVAYESRDEASAAAMESDETVVVEALSLASGFTVNELQARHSVAAAGASSFQATDAPDLWSTRNKVGFGASVASVIVLLGMLVYAEDFRGGGHNDDDSLKGDV